MDQIELLRGKSYTTCDNSLFYLDYKLFMAKFRGGGGSKVEFVDVRLTKL